MYMLLQLNVLSLSCTFAFPVLSSSSLSFRFHILFTIFPLHQAIKNGNVGLDGRLVDQEGYPRNGIDVYAVRKARN